MTLLQFISEQRRHLPQPATADACSGKTYIVTGANVGLGFEAAKTLVRVGAAKVILAVRNTDAGKAAKAQIDQETQTRNVTEVWPLDLSSNESIKKFAEMANSLDRIDGLIENAAVALGCWSMTEGHETCVKVNVLSTVLLAVLMIPKLEECARKFQITPRIAIVTSSVGFMMPQEGRDKITMDPGRNWNDERLGIPQQIYQRSKMFLSFAVRELTGLIPVSRGVIINLVNPGFCKTSLSRNGTLMQRAMFEAMKVSIGRTAEKGSRTLLHGAVAGVESHGCYLSSCEIMESQVPSWVTNEDGKRVQRKVWDAVAVELEKAAPDCLNKIL